MSDDLKARTRATYDAAADHFDASPLTFWDVFGRGTIERVAPQPGWQMLDVCCGTGASAIPAAEAVGPAGRVVGVDLSEQLLALARAKTTAMPWAEFRHGDMEDLPFPDGSFDAVVCVFGIFFVPDMTVALRELWRVLRSGGTLAITTWGRDVLEPGTRSFWDAVARVRPDLDQTYQPWMRVNSEHEVRALLASCGIDEARIDAASEATPLSSPEDWWQIVLGTGYRGTTDQMTDTEREEVRAQNLAAIADVDEVRSDVLYATAVKP